MVYGCESWTIKKAEHQIIDACELWCWRRLLRVSWTARRSNQSILKEILPIFIGRTGDEAEAPVLWPPDAKSWLIRKDPDAGKDWKQGKGTTEDEMAGCHHQLDGHEFVQASGDGDGQGSLACCSSWGLKESDTTERLNWIDWIDYKHSCARLLGTHALFFSRVCIRVELLDERVYLTSGILLYIARLSSKVLY